jgi:hypothetical protein
MVKPGGKSSKRLSWWPKSDGLSKSAVTSDRDYVPKDKYTQPKRLRQQSPVYGTGAKYIQRLRDAPSFRRKLNVVSCEPTKACAILPIWADAPAVTRVKRNISEAMKPGARFIQMKLTRAGGLGFKTRRRCPAVGNVPDVWITGKLVTQFWWKCFAIHPLAFNQHFAADSGNPAFIVVDQRD